MPRIPRPVRLANPGRFATVGACAMVFAVACRAPQVRSNLHYQPAPATGWRELSDGHLAQSQQGVAIEVTMAADAPQLELSFVNDAPTRVVVRLGPESMRAASTAIGEVQLRHVDRARHDGTTDYLPYLAMQDFEIPPGGRAVFYLDSPLGRDPLLGQYFVLAIELRREGAPMMRSLLPLQATNVPRQGAAVPESSRRRP